MGSNTLPVSEGRRLQHLPAALVLAALGLAVLVDPVATPCAEPLPPASSSAIPQPPPLETLGIVAMRLVPGLLDVEPSSEPLSSRVGTEPPAGLDLSALPPGPRWYGNAPVTKTESLSYVVSTDRSFAWLDSDMNHRLDATERVQPLGTPSGGITWFAVGGLVRQPRGDGSLREAIIPMVIGIGPGAAPMGFNRLDCHREGEIQLGGRTVRLAVVDRTYRGWFSHPGRDALLVDVDGDGTWEAGDDSHERYRLGQPFPVGDLDVVVQEYGPLGETLKLARSPKPAKRMPPLVVGAPAPDFSATDLAGKPVSLSSFKGRFVLLDFWATWCAPCRAEMPNLKALRKEHPQVVVLGISGDRELAALQGFAAHEAIDWPQVFDDKGTLQGLFRVKSLPRSLLVGPDGRIAARDLRGAMLGALIGREIAKSAPPTPGGSAHQ